MLVIMLILACFCLAVSLIQVGIQLEDGNLKKVAATIFSSIIWGFFTYASIVLITDS